MEIKVNDPKLYQTSSSYRHTTSPAVAERPRDALCLSVASIVQYVQYVVRYLLLLVTSASGLPLRTIKFCSLLFVIVVHAGCDKQDH